ncbi:MAG: hypothetical protein AAGI30_01485 [Planctomycetota bacterium]
MESESVIEFERSAVDQENQAAAADERAWLEAVRLGNAMKGFAGILRIGIVVASLAVLIGIAWQGSPSNSALFVTLAIGFLSLLLVEVFSVWGARVASAPHPDATGELEELRIPARRSRAYANVVLGLIAANVVGILVLVVAGRLQFQLPDEVVMVLTGLLGAVQLAALAMRVFLWFAYMRTAKYAALCINAPQLAATIAGTWWLFVIFVIVGPITAGILWLYAFVRQSIIYFALTRHAHRTLRGERQTLLGQAAEALPV